MFVFVDPSGTDRQKNLRRSEIRSYAASLVHQRRSFKIVKTTRTIATPVDDAHSTKSSTRNAPLAPAAKRGSGASQSCWALERTSSEANESKDTATAATAKQDKLTASRDGSSTYTFPSTFLSVHGGDLTWPERRAMYFFQNRTAHEWCNWGEMRLMMQFLPQASVQIPALRHAMISLGAYHQYLETKPSLQRTRIKNMAIANANQTLTQFRTDQSLLTIGTILMAHVVLTLTVSTLNDASRLQAEYMQYELVDNVKRMMKQKSPLITPNDSELLTTFLFPLINRQESREGLFIDAVYCLQNTKAAEFCPPRVPPTPFFFDSIEKAYFVAETVLENAAYSQKTSPAPAGSIPEECILHLEHLRDALDRFALGRAFDPQEQLTVSILRVAVNLGAMMVAVMNAENETVFDEYNHLYDNLNTVLQATHTFTQDNFTVNVTFGLSAGLLIFASNCVLRWCREPLLRSKLIDTLANMHRMEGIEGSSVWAAIAKAVQHAEESAITPAPKSCADIPETSRVMVNAIYFYEMSEVVKLELLRDPWNKCILEEVWIPWDGNQDDVVEQLTPIPRQEVAAEMPIYVMGRGYTSRLEQVIGERYQTRCPRFYFPLPRR